MINYVFVYICELKVDIFGIIIVSVLMKTRQIRFSKDSNKHTKTGCI